MSSFTFVNRSRGRHPILLGTYLGGCNSAGGQGMVATLLDQCLEKEDQLASPAGAGYAGAHTQNGLIYF